MISIRNNHKLVGLFLALIMIMSLVVPTSIFALESWDDSNVEKISLAGNLSEEVVKDCIKKANIRSGYKLDSDDGTYLIIGYKGIDYPLLRVTSSTVEIQKTTWSTAKDKDVSKVMQNFVDTLNESEASADAIQSFMDEFQDADNSISSIMLTMSFSNTKADMYQAYKIMKPFLDILNIVLGVGCVCLIILLMFSTVMDLAYIGLPVWRESQAEKNGSGKKPFGVSYEALRTVSEVESSLGTGDGGYKNSYLLYFKRRALTYIVLALCIMYLICGGISGVISFVLKLVGGMV